MREIKHIVFDFDGTLVDTIDSSIKTYNKIAPEFRCRPVTQEERKLLLTQKPQIVLRQFGISNFKLFFIVLRMRKELGKQIAETEAVKNMPFVLHQLKNAGYRLGILTTNSRKNVIQFLDNKHLLELFDFVYSGKNVFGKDKVIRRMIKHEHLLKEEILYVGDEVRDVEASMREGIRVAAVTWGFNSKEILAASFPDGMLDDPAELMSFLEQAKNFV